MSDNNEFMIRLLALLEKQKSKTQINTDIKDLEKLVRKLKLTATLAKGTSKTELNQTIKQLESQLRQIKLQAKIDNRQLNREINNALRNVSARDINLNFNSNGERLTAQVRRAVAQAREVAERSPISVNIDLKREKPLNQLTAFTNKHTKINESSYWLGEAERLRTVISSVTNRDELRNATDQLQVFTSGVRATGYAAVSTTDRIKGMLGNIIKVGNYFGLAFVAVNKFRQSLNTLKTNDTILTEISKTSEMTKQQLKELGDEAFKVASKYGQVSGNYLTAVQEMARSGYEMLSKELAELSLLAQSAGDMTADSANNYLLATDAAYKYSGSVEKLNAALDGANYISNKNSANLTDIADATRVSASFAANAGVAIDELTAAEATMIAVTKRSGSEIGRAFRSIVLNLQQVSGEFDGEVIDEEQLKKVEDRCHSLGVELEYMQNGIATLRNPMEVLKDLADVYNSLPDNSAEKQGLISMTATFWDTVVMCAITGIVVVMFVLQKESALVDVSAGLLVKEAFGTLPLFGEELIAIATVCFAVATLIGWSYFGQVAAEYMGGKEMLKKYQYIYVIMIFSGAVMPMGIVWEITDFINVFILLPAVYALLKCRKMLF